jgi:hypothetical protein
MEWTIALPQLMTIFWLVPMTTLVELQLCGSSLAPQMI